MEGTNHSKVSPMTFMYRSLLALGILLFTAGCGGGGDTAESASVGGESSFSTPRVYGIPVYAPPQSPEEYGLAPLDDAAFDALDPAQRYKVAIKLYGSLYYGTDPKSFRQSVDSGRFVSETRALFERENAASEIAAVEDKVGEYGGYGDAELVGRMLARLYEMKPGRAYINRWAAYVLTQTILFSPAYELDTVYSVDAIDVFANLVRGFDEGQSLQWVTFTHMVSDENWRRFRSPEDNGREMLEIYTMDFNDAHVPLAGKALKNWRLDRRSDTLVVGLDANTEPIRGLFPDRTVTDGTDFYSALVLEPAFVPSVTRRLVDIYFPDYTESQKESIGRRIAKSRPGRWSDILKQIVFSREYLLHSHKTRSFEESFFQIAKTLGWVPKKYSFYRLARNLDAMHQSTMRYKLGRKVEVPLDSQSFAWYHKTIRENVMTNYETNVSWEAGGDGGWPLSDLYAELPADLIADDELDERGRKQESWYANERRRAAYIVNDLFVPIAGREATAEEIGALADLIDDRKHDRQTFDNPSWVDLYGNRDPKDDRKERGYFAQMVLNYLSRLDMVYEFEKVQ